MQFLIFFSLFSSSIARPSSLASLIVGGKPVNPPFKYPWLVTLQEKNIHFCGGSLLDSSTVLTAAHCSTGITDEIMLNLTVLAHRHDLRLTADKENGLTFKVRKVYLHPEYNSSNHRYDVAVWKVSPLQPDHIGLDSIGSNIILDEDGVHGQDGAQVIVGGWGTTSDGGKKSSILLETEINIVNQDKCRDEYSDLSPTSICAAAPGRDTCHSDSGGPMFQMSSNSIFLVGITSYGSGCGDANYAGVYSRISLLAPWIKSVQSAPI